MEITGAMEIMRIMGTMGTMGTTEVMGTMEIMRIMRTTGIMGVLWGLGASQAVSRAHCRAKPGHNCIGYIIQLHWLYNNVGDAADIGERV